MKIPRPGVLKDLLSEAGAGQKGNSKSWILTCPRCQKKDKLYIRKTDGRFVCWVCKEIDNFQGSPEYVLSELLGRTPSELRYQLFGDDQGPAQVFLSLSLRDFYEDEEVDEKKEDTLPEVELDPGFRDLDSEWGLPGLKYLESRGISIDLAKKYDLRYWPAQRRVVFPVKSQSRLVGWQSRYIDTTEWIDEETGAHVKIPKALTYSGLKKDRALMFSDRIHGDHAVLCEGPIDAIKADLCGGNVATMGKAVSHYQLELLRNSGIKKLYIGFDPDAASEIKRVVDLMYRDLEIYDMRPPSGAEDLGSMTPEAVLSCYNAAPRVNPGTLFVYIKDPYERR